MKRLPAALACTVVMFAGQATHAQTPVWLEIDLKGVPIEFVPQDRTDAETRLRGLILNELKDDFHVWNWNPPDRKGAKVITVTFSEDSNEVFVKFAFTTFPFGELPGPNNSSSSIQVSKRNKLAPLTNKPIELAEYLHQAIKPKLQKSLPSWRDPLCKRLPIAEITPLAMHSVTDLDILLPYTHPSYRWSKFDIKAKNPKKGDVELAVQGLNTIVRNHLQAHILEWIEAGKVVSLPPPNADKELAALVEVRAFLKSLDPSVDPNYKSSSNP